MHGSLSRRAVLRLAGVLGAGGLAAGRAGATAGDDPEYPSRAWFEREFRNYAKTQEAPSEQARDPAFQRRWREQSAANGADYLRRTRSEPGWRSHGNLCATYGEQCTGDPFLYPSVDGFYGTRGVRERVAFHDRDGARLSGHVWAPADATGSLPGVVVTNGSLQAPETAYWWFAQTLAAAGYVVLTYDPRGQGRSDTVTPDGAPGSNADPSVFVTNQVDAIDFFRSTPAAPYPPNENRTADPAPVRAYNPFHDRLDRDRVGAVGHSLGATGVSVVQGLDPWPGTADANPVDAAVAWDNLAPAGEELAGHTVCPRVPAMGQSADYGLTPTPKERPPDEDAKARAFEDWRAAGVSAYQLVVRGGTHYEWSRVPTFPATAWGFGNALADHYSLAWLDRWLKEPDEPGYRDADDRLLADDEWADRLSFYYRSARAFPDRRGFVHECGDVRAGCESDAPPERD